MFNFTMLAAFSCFFLLFVLGDARSEKQHVTEVFRLIQEGERSITSIQRNQITFVFGDFGSGKNSLLDFLLVNNNQLKVKKEGLVYSIDELSSKNASNLPEVLVSAETGDIFIDCPEFSDDRDVSSDIAANYLLTRALDKVDSVRLISVVSYSTVQESRGLDLFLSRLARLVADTEDLKAAMGLVVTGVPVEESVTDEQAVSKVREELVSRTLDTESSTRILTAVLDRAHGEKITIFRKPTQEGLLSQSTVMQNNKNSIMRMVSESVQYVNKAGIDFSTVVLEKSRLFIEEKLMDEIDIQILNICLGVRTFLEMFVVKFGMQSQDPTLTRIEIDKLINLMPDSTLTDNTNSQFQDNINSLIVYISSHRASPTTHEPSFQTDFQQAWQQFLFFSSVSKSNKSPIDKCLIPLNEYTNNLKSIVDIYNKIFDEFNTNLENPLTQLRKTVTWPFLLLNGVRPGTTATLPYILKNLVKGGLVTSETALHAQSFFPQTPQFLLRDLTNLVNRCSRKISCVNGSMVLESQIISIFSDVLWAIEHEYCHGTFDSITIVAAKKILIDSDVRTDKDLYMVSPGLEVVGRRVIDLSGARGRDHGAPAVDGVWEEEEGSDGLPGVPGQPGANFVVVTRHIANSRLLTVDTSGGAGGSGQDGGRGASGFPASLPVLSADRDFKLFGTEENFMDEMQRFGFRVQRKSNWTQYPILPDILSMSTTIFTYRVEGSAAQSGSEGGRGGDGGVGGEGGEAGLLKITDFTGATLITDVVQVKRTGATGHPGKGGLGGEGGETQGGTYIRCELEYFSLHYVPQPFSFNCSDTGDTFKGTPLPAGPAGRNNTNVWDAEPKSGPRAFHTSTISQFITKFD